MKRKPKNDTPRMPRAAKTATVYIRVDAGVVDRIRRTALERGRPHTFSSVAAEALASAYPEAKP
jgi:hypothetical protein